MHQWQSEWLPQMPAYDKMSCHWYQALDDQTYTCLVVVVQHIFLQLEGPYDAFLET